MTKSPLSGLATTLLALVAPCLLPAALRAGQGETPVILHLVPALAEELRGDCTARLEPDEATISGAVSAESVKPTQAHAMIEKRLEAIRAFVAEVGGRLELGERLRAVRNERDRGTHVADQPAPFLALQRIEVVLPADREVDAVLDRLLALGMDRLGRDIRPDIGGSRPQVAVHFGVGDPKSALDALETECRRQALDAWCLRHVPAALAESCRKELGRLEPHFKTQGLRLQSQPVALGDGRQGTLSFSHPWRSQEIDRLVLGGRVALELTGWISLRAVLP